MAGKKENLKPVQNTEEARERGRKGGVASGQARREKATLRAALEMLMDMPVEGLDKSNREGMAAALVRKALAGDVKAFEVVRDIIGEKPANKVDMNADLAIATVLEEARRRVEKLR